MTDPGRRIHWQPLADVRMLGSDEHAPVAVALCGRHGIRDHELGCSLKVEGSRTVRAEDFESQPGRVAMSDSRYGKGAERTTGESGREDGDVVVLDLGHLSAQLRPPMTGRRADGHRTFRDCGRE